MPSPDYMIVYRRFDFEKVKACLTEVGAFCRDVRSADSKSAVIPLCLVEYSKEVRSSIQLLRKRGYAPPTDIVEKFTRTYDLKMCQHVPTYGPAEDIHSFHHLLYSNQLVTGVYKNSRKLIRESEGQSNPGSGEYPVYVPFEIHEDEMTASCIEYYLFWKHNVDMGRYYATDQYYVQVYILELLLDGIDVSELKGKYCGKLESLADAYSRDLVTEYLMLKDEPLFTNYTWQPYRQYALWKFITGGPGNISSDNQKMLLKELGYQESFYSRSRPNTYLLILTNLFWRICREYPEGVPGLNAILWHPKVIKDALDLTEPVIVRICVPSSEFIKEFGMMSEDVEYFYWRYVRERYTRKMPVKYFGMNIVPFMNKLLDRFFNPPKMVEVKIDADAVRAAQEDLDYVVATIASHDEPPEEEAPAEEKRTAVDGDLWSSMKGKLSDSCLEYLKKCMSGTKAVNRLEDDINGIALDTVGDTIVEGGRIVEDYREDLTRILT